MILPSKFNYLLALIFSFMASVGVKAQTFEKRSMSAEDSLRSLLFESKSDTNRVNVLLQLGNPTMDITGTATTNLDTAYSYSEKADVLSKLLRFSKGEIAATYQLGYIYLQKKEYQKSREVIQRGLALAEKEGYLELQGEGWHFLGDSYDAADKKMFLEKIRCFYKAIELFRKSGDLRSEGEILYQLANLEDYKGNYESARSKLLQALHIYDSLNEKDVVPLYEGLTRAERGLGNYPAALQNGLAGLRIAHANQDSAILPFLHITIGLIYSDLFQNEKALKQYKDALWHASKRKIGSIESNAVVLIAQALTRSGKASEGLAFIDKMQNELDNKIETQIKIAIARTECYLALKKFDLAEENIKLSLGLWKSQTDRYANMSNYQRAANLYLEMSMYDKSRKYLNQAMVINDSLKSLKAAMDQHIILFKLDSAQGKYLNAIKNYQRFKVLHDSLLMEGSSNRIASLQIEHETLEKEQYIERLTRKDEIQQANLKQKDIQQNVTIAGIILLLLFVLIIYNRNRTKQRVNQLLQAKQEEINQKNERLLTVLSEKETLLISKDVLLEEKEWLLKEIHHRVKNNLQIVMSLLNSQSAYLKDDTALLAIQDSQHRVYAISLIHQKLYQDGNVATIDMSAYIRELINYLSDAFHGQGDVHFQLDVAQVQLDVGVAVPLGLILNEAVTNSLKYAFPNGISGTVAITLDVVGKSGYRLAIADNGVGFKDDAGISQTNSLGISLMKGLARQLGGTIAVENVDGVTMSVAFPADAS